MAKKSADKKGEKGSSKSSEDAESSKGKVSVPSTIIERYKHLIDVTGQGKGALKAATAVNLRHILCEKHSKATEALQKIQVCRASRIEQCSWRALTPA